MDSIFPCYTLLRMRVTWLNMVFAPPPITMGWLNLKICQTFSLETVNTQKSEVFLLKISSGNVNASVVTCQYPQIYNFSFRKEFLETLCKCIYLEF